MSRVSKSFVCAVSVGIWGAATLNAQESATSKKLDQVLIELREIKEMIGRQPSVQPQPPARVAIAVGHAPVLGSSKAPMTVVMFTDYECSFCRQFRLQTFENLKTLYIDSGKARFYVLDFPIESRHKNALLAAQAGRCAAEQGKFWQMYHRMQSSSADELEFEHLMTYAGELGLKVAKFRNCVESGKYKADIQEKALDARRKGISGTPSFVIGKSTSEGVHGELVIGAVPFGIFERKLGPWQEGARNPAASESQDGN